MADDIIHEEWREIPSFPGYEASSLGRIRHIVYLTGHPQSDKRIGVTMRRNKKTTRKLIHQLICEAFHGPKPPGKECVAHKDGNFRNNLPGNLRWSTNKENMNDKREHGTHLEGERHGMAILTEVAVHQIRRDIAAGMSQSKAGAKHGVSQSAVWRIMTGQTWGWLKTPNLQP